MCSGIGGGDDEKVVIENGTARFSVLLPALLGVVFRSRNLAAVLLLLLPTLKAGRGGVCGFASEMDPESLSTGTTDEDEIGKK